MKDQNTTNCLALTPIIPPLDPEGRNWDAWSARMTALLTEEQLMQFVKHPNRGVFDVESKVGTARTARIILCSIDDECFHAFKVFDSRKRNYVLNCDLTSPYEMWNRLKEKFEQENFKLNHNYNYKYDGKY